MKKIFVVSVLCFSALISNYCQTKQESIKELFRIMQQDSLTSKTLTAILPSVINQTRAQLNDPASKAMTEEITKYSFQLIKEITSRLINEDMVVIYDRYFTQDEINDFIAFYKSPSGQKMIRLSPDISKDVMTLMMQKYTPEMQRKIQAKMEEIKARDK